MVWARWTRRSWSSARSAGAAQRKYGFLKNVDPAAMRLVMTEITKDASQPHGDADPQADEDTRHVD